MSKCVGLTPLQISEGSFTSPSITTCDMWYYNTYGNINSNYTIYNYSNITKFNVYLSLANELKLIDNDTKNKLNCIASSPDNESLKLAIGILDGVIKERLKIKDE